MQFLDDLKYSLRLILKTPAFTAITLLVIVMGLSLYMASMTLGKNLRDQSLPFPKSDRFVALKSIDPVRNLESGRFNFDWYSYNFLKQSNSSFETLGAFIERPTTLSDGDYAKGVLGSKITANLLSATQIKPLLGRSLSQQDMLPGAMPVVLIDSDLWKNYYNGDESIIGKIARVDGKAMTIVGILPGDFGFPFMSSLWSPLINDSAVTPGGEEKLSVVGVLNTGSNIQSATLELKSLMRQLTTEYPEYYSEDERWVAPYASLVAQTRLGLDTIMNGISLIILALATVNLSSLLFIRSSTRQQELAVRSSVGANGLQLARQVLLESFLICLIGFVISLVICSVMLQILEYRAIGGDKDQNYFWFSLALDGKALLVGLLCTLFIWLSSSGLVAFKAYGSDPGILLSAANKGKNSRSKAITTQLVVGFEVVVAFFLLSLCWVLTHTLSNLLNADHGVDKELYSVSDFNLNTPYYETPGAKLSFLNSLTLQIETSPLFDSASITTSPPGRPGINVNYDLADRDLEQNNLLPSLEQIWTSDDYFSTIAVSLLQGRSFESSDTGSSMLVGIITEAYANRLWPNESAIGKQILLVDGPSGEEELVTIVGLLANLGQSQIPTIEADTLYRPLSQNSPSNYFLITQPRPEIPIDRLTQEIRTSANSIDRDIAIDNFRSLSREMEEGLGGVGPIIEVFMLFSFFTIVLASIGIFGVISRSITLRIHETGIRRALGSSNLKIVSAYLIQSCYFLLAGILIGGGGALLLEVAGSNAIGLKDIVDVLPITLLQVTLTITVVVFFATYLPARKAVRMEPGDALRWE